MIDIREKLAGRGPAIAAGSAAALVLAALAWLLCTQPLAPAGAAGSGSAEPSVTAVTAKNPKKEPDGKKAKTDEDDKAAADKGDKTGKDEKKDATPTAKEGEQPSAAGAAKSGSDKAGSQASPPPSGGSTSSKPAQKPSGSGGGSKPVPAPQASQPETQEPAPQPAPKPQHQHSWQAVYRDEPVYGEQWVPKIEIVYTRHERYVCTTCGASYGSISEINAHLDSTIDWDTMTGHAGYLDDSYTTKEEVDRGSYQTVQTGTKQVLDHYACSCGAVK